MNKIHSNQFCNIMKVVITEKCSLFRTYNKSSLLRNSIFLKISGKYYYLNILNIGNVYQRNSFKKITFIPYVILRSIVCYHIK